MPCTKLNSCCTTDIFCYNNHTESAYQFFNYKFRQMEDINDQKSFQKNGKENTAARFWNSGQESIEIIHFLEGDGMLNTSDYQNIVERVIGILGKNINIMNTGGIIIASGDETRIGSFHEIAAMAAAESREIIVASNQAPEFQGVKPGVNLPINFNDEVIGVVGITGNPEDVAGYGKIIKELVELMVQDKQQKKLDLFQYRAVRDLIKELIKTSDPKPDEITYLENRAALVGFDLKKERALLLADIVGFKDYIAKNNLSEVEIQEIKQSVIDYIASGSDSQDIVFNLNEDRFIVFKTSGCDIYDFCRNKHQRIFNRIGIRTIFSIGSTCSRVLDYHHAYVTAVDLLDIADKLGNIFILSKDAFDVHLLMHRLPKEAKIDYVNQFESKLFNDKNSFMATVKVFFECGMDMKEAAAKLFVHKNTLIYRLNKFKELYNQDPFNPYQCMKIYLGIVMSEV